MLKTYVLRGVKYDSFITVKFVTYSLDKISKFINDIGFSDVDVYSDDFRYLFSYCQNKHIVKEIF